ncbi:class I tRNA ligase family protein, partial [Rhizobium leguminosarum]|uniref:class I tRNA ligase family protein n=1 Tax=Rhizobium leguminosarum TaxID=384 RepID=UPI003F9CC2B0
RIYELVNALAAPMTRVAAGEGDATYRAAVRDAAEILIQLVSPITPHLAEECWTALGNEGLFAPARRPQYDKTLVLENNV